MVGKLQTKCSNKSTEANDSIAAAEYSYLKNKNQEFAKALAQAKSECRQILAERDYLQKELLCANIQIKKLESYIDIIEDSTKNTFNKIVGCSSDITKALQTIHLAKRITRKLENDVNNASFSQMSMENKVGTENSPLVHNHSNLPTNHTKTHVVKPMVSGHVIFRPIISLRRVNEDEIERSMNLGAQHTTEHTNTSQITEEAVTQETEQQQNTSFRCQSTGFTSSHSILSGDLSGLDENNFEIEDEQVPNDTNETEVESAIENNRLQTLQEEDEISEPLNNNSEPSSERNNSKDMMIGLFTGVKLFTYNSAQEVSTVGTKKTNLSCTGDSSSQMQENSEATGRVPMVTTHRGGGERVNFESSSDLSSYSVENENTLLSTRVKCGNSNLSEPSTSGLNIRKSSPQTNTVTQVGNSPRNNSTIISGTKPFKTFVANGTTVNGLSVLLENLNSNDISKIQQLSTLGLEPTFLKNNTSTPFSPVGRIKRTNRKPKEISSSSESSSQWTPGTPSSTSSDSIEITPKRKISHEKSKYFKNKKQAMVGNPKVILKRLIIPKRNSKSPVKVRGSRTLGRTFSQSSIESNDGVSSRNKIHSTKRSIDETPSGKPTRGSKEKTPKRRRLTKKQSKKSEIELFSPKKLSNSPIKARRRGPVKSFKEPSLISKMRRSK